MKIFLPTIFACMLIFDLQAQQDPLHAQYFNNPMLINPAVAGNTDRLFVGVGYRKQWSGIEGGPAIVNFNSHIALIDNKVGAGIIVVQDKIGEFKTTHYAGTFSYKIKLQKSTLSFGMQLGLVQYSTNSEHLNILNPDALFVPYSETKFNTGAGLLLKNDRYTIGLSAPQLLANSADAGDESVTLSNQNYYLYGSYSSFLSERIEFKPSVLLRGTQGTSLTADVNLNFTLNTLYTAGLFSRNLNTYGVLLQIVVKNCRFGYVFELPGKDSALNFNTHEISLALSLDVLKSHHHFMSDL